MLPVPKQLMIIISTLLGLIGLINDTVDIIHVLSLEDDR